jgi:hypothetical protein
MVVKPSGSNVNEEALRDYIWRATTDKSGRTVWVLDRLVMEPIQVRSLPVLVLRLAKTGYSQ